MRRLLVLTLVCIPSLAAAQPAQTITDHLAALSPTPDLKPLTTEPVERTQSSGYGWREDPIRKRQKFHHGSDYRGEPGTPILAAGAGVVTLAKRYYGYGKCVFVDHGGGVITRYAHMRRIDVKAGDMVDAGARLGQMGSTGRTTGPHLHFEVRLDGRSVDPNTALAVAAVMRENPVAGQLALLSLSPEIQAHARDVEDPKNHRPERRGAPKRERALW